MAKILTCLHQRLAWGSWLEAAPAFQGTGVEWCPSARTSCGAPHGPCAQFPWSAARPLWPFALKSSIIILLRSSGIGWKSTLLSPHLLLLFVNFLGLLLEIFLLFLEGLEDLSRSLLHQSVFPLSHSHCYTLVGLKNSRLWSYFLISIKKLENQN